MRLKTLVATGSLLTTVVLAGCGASDTISAPSTSTRSATSAPSPTPSAPPTVATEASADQVVGTVVRFSKGSTRVEVTIDQDSPAVRDFLSMLPLTLTLEEFAGREKIADPPRELAYAGPPDAGRAAGAPALLWSAVGLHPSVTRRAVAPAEVPPAGPPQPGRRGAGGAGRERPSGNGIAAETALPLAADQPVSTGFELASHQRGVTTPVSHAAPSHLTHRARPIR